MYKYLIGSAVSVLLVACAGSPRSEHQARMSVSHSAAEKSSSRSISMEDVDVAGWLDNPSAVMLMDADHSSGPGPGSEGSLQPLEPKDSHIDLKKSQAQFVDLEAMVSLKVGHTDQELQSLRVIGETGRININPKWPAIAPLKSDTLLLAIGSQLVESTERYRIYKVPAGKLDEAMDLLTPLGEVEYEQILGEDLSLEMGGVERRSAQLKLLEAKYKLLLTQVKEEEKAKVLKLLERVIQDLQVLTQRQKLLKEKSQWATLRVNFSVQSYRHRESSPQALYWIGELRPWGAYLQADNQALELDLVKPFIEVDIPRDNPWSPSMWRATEGRGSSVRAWESTTLPIADETFWHQALEIQLRKRYEEVNCEVKGDSTKWNWCLFRVSQEDSRWSYLALRPRDKSSDVTKLVQIDFPTQELKDQYLSAWTASVKKAMEE